MKKRGISFMLAFALLFSFCALNYSPLGADDNSEFKSKLVEIYKKYGSETKSNSSFALKRLMLSDYSGEDTFGASDWAFDKKHKFAVLQYESEGKAKAAFEKINKLGIAVDTDGKAKIDSYQKGSVFPEGSNALGTPSYISKFNMAKDDVVVAVIDTGVMYDHELMANRFVSRGFDFSDDGRSNAYYDTSMNDAFYGHGTFVCGIIADNTPDNVKILPYKAVAFGESEASNSAIVAAMYDAVDRGASVINVSMSTTSGASAFRYAVETALRRNVCVVASAGNNSKEIKYRYPAAIPGVITASSVESDMETFASFSNYGTAVDFCAPGRKIVSACPYKSGEEKFTQNSGTSFSAPYITAACADIKSIKNSLSKDEVYSVLCDFSTDLGQEGYDIYFGNGMPNLANMLYTDNKTYFFSIPEGWLEIIGNTADYTAETQPWKLFADKMLSVSIYEGVDSVGSYSFYNMVNAEFNMPCGFINVGDYAFNSCKKIDSVEFGIDVVNIGEGAFGELDETFSILGYRNTAAEVYSQREGISFVPIGCKHNYFADVIDPTDEEEGYTIYTCTVCGDYYIGEYIEPPEYYDGECGMGVTWKYLTKEKSLEISGSGYMLSYSEENPAPWSAFSKKIKSVLVGEDVTDISDYLLSDAINCETLKIYSKTAEISDKTVVFSEGAQSKIVFYAYDDSNAKDYFSKNEIDYVSLGCAHSRNVEFYEEQPSCCYDTYGVYTCSDCGDVRREYISRENKGHYFSGVINTLDYNAISNAEVYVDGVLSAITNSNGKYIVYPILCGSHSVEIKKHGAVIDSFEIEINRCNLRNSSQCCYGDFVCNGYVNAKDYAYAVKNGFDDANIFDYGKVSESVEESENYEVQELPHAWKVTNVPNDESDVYRDFVAIIENYSEFEIKESGFVYGKNMSEDMLYLDNVGAVNSEGFSVKQRASSDNDAYEKILRYGSSAKKGILSARFYIIYTNGVKDFVYYSGVTSYEY